MKLGPMTKLGKRNTAMSKKIDDDDVSASYDVIDIVFYLWPILSNLDAGFRTHGLWLLYFN